jgi:hypothetical protein
MLNIEVNRSAQGVEQYFDCELAVSDYLMKEPGHMGGRRSRTVRTMRPGATVAFCRVVAKRKSDDG